MGQGTLQLPSCQLQLRSPGENYPSTSIYSREKWHPRGSREQQVWFGFLALLSDQLPELEIHWIWAEIRDEG